MLRKFLVAALVGIAATSQVNADLIVTGVFDGPLAGGVPKVVEIYVRSTTDLSRYGVGSANNGGGTDGVENILSGTANAGTFIYMIDEGNAAVFMNLRPILQVRFQLVR